MQDENARLRTRLEAIEAQGAEHERQEGELVAIRDKCRELEASLEWPRYVVNMRTACVHHSGGYGKMPQVGGLTRTPCGWEYTAATGQVVREPPPNVCAAQVCARCLPDLRARLSVVNASSSPTDSGAE